MVGERIWWGGCLEQGGLWIWKDGGKDAGTDVDYLVVDQDGRGKVKLKQAGVKLDIRENFLNMQSHQ